MRKILYISGTRADYGLMKSVLKEIELHPALSLEIVATGMHLMDKFGNTITEIEKDGFKVHKIDVVYKEDNRESMAEFIGEFVQKLNQKVSAIKPDIILVLGDRAEMLAGAIVGTYLGIPVAQIHGGEVTSTVDESSRHAITKLANIHLPATEESAERILKMGENKRYVYSVGAPGLDRITKEPIPKNIIEEKFGLDLSKGLMIVLQHPVSQEISDAKKQMTETMEAATSFNLPVVAIYPNADAGRRAMISALQEYEKNPLVKTFKNIPHAEFLSLMNYASIMIGNSSSGIIEAPSFSLPVVNIGTRQEGRQRVPYVLDVDYKKEEIVEAIKKALYDQKFIENIRRCKNPYGDGKASQRIAKILSEIEINKDLLQKKMVY